MLIFLPYLAGAQKVLFVTGEWAPYTTEKTADQGFISEIVKAVSAEAGIKYKLAFYPWKRCEDMVKDGAAFGAFPYVSTPERMKEFDFSESLGETRGVFFYDTSAFPTPPTWATFKDLKAFTIGGVLGTLYEKDFAAAGLKVDYAGSDELNLTKLAKGRIQIVPADELLGRLFFKNNFPQVKIGTMAKPLNQDSLRLLVSRTYPGSKTTLAAFNAALAQIKAKGIYGKILAKYGLK